MSDSDFSDTPPPEVPEEFGDAYREAYRRAYAEAPGPPRLQTAPAPPLPGVSSAASTQRPVLPPPPPAVPAAPAATRTTTRHRAEPPVLDQFRASKWFVPSLLAALALFLILLAYVAGRMFAGGVDETAAPLDTPSVDASATPTGKATPTPTPTTTPKPDAYSGAITVAPVASAAAACTSKPGVDSSGRPTTYTPDHMIDADTSTAWRCDGLAVGQKLAFTLGGPTSIGEVALIPGYAKTDPTSKVDRYAENNRITRVRWSFSDGTSVEQTVSADAKDRSLRRLRVPVTVSDTVTLEILAVAKGSRNTTAISQVAFGVTR